jgi:hypothetical protein
VFTKPKKLNGRNPDAVRNAREESTTIASILGFDPFNTTLISLLKFLVTFEQPKIPGDNTSTMGTNDTKCKSTQSSRRS